jgi:hypothetical protein
LIRAGHDLLDEAGPRLLVQAYMEELARFIGTRHGYQYAGGVQPRQAGSGHSAVREKAVRK